MIAIRQSAKQKQLNDFEKECILHGEALATELLKDNLKFQSIAQAKIIEVFDHENEEYTKNMDELTNMRPQECREVVLRDDLEGKSVRNIEANFNEMKSRKDADK